VRSKYIRGATKTDGHDHFWTFDMRHPVGDALVAPIAIWSSSELVHGDKPATCILALRFKRTNSSMLPDVCAFIKVGVRSGYIAMPCHLKPSQINLHTIDTLLVGSTIIQVLNGCMWMSLHARWEQPAKHPWQAACRLQLSELCATARLQVKRRLSSLSLILSNPQDFANV
jgi:hypothetical protein